MTVDCCLLQHETRIDDKDLKWRCYDGQIFAEASHLHYCNDGVLPNPVHVDLEWTRCDNVTRPSSVKTVLK